MTLLSSVKIENETDCSITISKSSWNEIVKLDTKKDKKNITKEALREYAGSINLDKNPLNFQKEIRNEWQ